MPAVSQLEITNNALSRIRASLVSSIAEDSLSAREARRFYPRAISDMLDGPFDHDWSFANMRVALAEVATDRAAEYAFAYQVPANMASPIRLLPNLEGVGLGLPIPLGGDPYMEVWSSFAGYYEAPYVIEANKIYTNIENAVFDYAVNDITGLTVSSKVITALEIDLAARLAVPVKGDSVREKDLTAAARNAWEIAVADDRNRHPTIFGGYVSEAMAARRGYLPGMG